MAEWTQIRAVDRSDGKVRLVTAYLGNPLTVQTAKAAGLVGVDPQELCQADVRRVGNWLEAWILKGREQESKHKGKIVADICCTNTRNE